MAPLDVAAGVGAGRGERGPWCCLPNARDLGITVKELRATGAFQQKHARQQPAMGEGGGSSIHTDGFLVSSVEI